MAAPPNAIDLLADRCLFFVCFLFVALLLFQTGRFIESHSDFKLHRVLRISIANLLGVAAGNGSASDVAHSERDISLAQQTVTIDAEMTSSHYSICE